MRQTGKAPKADVPTFTVHTLGCKVNQSESDALEHSLVQAGWTAVLKGKSADVLVLNTCAITGNAARQSRQTMRHLLREHPDATIVATGCGVEFEPDFYQGLGVNAMAVRREAKHRLPAILRTNCGNGLATGDLFPETPSLPIGGDRTRPFLKIQDGCDASCAYCIVPKLRGPGRSMPLEDVLDRLERIGRAGFQEVVLTGIHLGSYGRDLSPPVSLLDLVDGIAASPPLERVRLSSIEPLEIDDDLVARVASNPLFCDHFHIPLQSGGNRILNAMGRPYTTAQFERRIRLVRARIPDAAIGADVLVGFPGEDDVCFEETLTFLESLPVTYLHVFPFSGRPGTRASSFGNPVPAGVIQERCRQVRELAGNKKNAFYRSFMAKNVRLLMEGRRDRRTGRLRGLTSNYIPVLVDGGDKLQNTFVHAVITGVDEDNTVSGRITTPTTTS